ncbi:hypothetical protein MED121_16719 [Marinomonas sp. MED121]|nr:hypothetical protein MED121_16719 [Marinomonas sp. MED121]
MKSVLTMKIDVATQSDMPDFFTYLTLQLAGNGRGDSPLFQPVSRDDSIVSVPTRQRFMQGVAMPMGEPGWRLLWLVKHETGQIMGHVDIRPYEDEHCQHRVLLGMGVDSHYRRQGLGRLLLEHSIEFCREQAHISWLDLNVLSTNQGAKQLYLNAGFQVLGEIEDRYRIDGVSVAETTMTLKTF